VTLRLLAATAPTTTADDDLFGGVNDFFDSGTWLVIRNLAGFFLVVFYFATVYWVYKDARRRIDDPWLVGVATVLGAVPFVGPVVYLFFRPPEYLEDVRERQLEIKAMEERLARPVLNCPVCRAEIDASYLACPVCTTKLKQACSNCRAPLEPIWQICPFCETPVDTPSVVRDFDEAWDEPAKPKAPTRARSSQARQRRTSSGSGSGSA
jgi:hypothetical protein